MRTAFIKSAAIAAALAWSAMVNPCSGKDDAAAPPLPFLHASGTAIAGDNGQPVLLHGCNFGNWLLIEPWMLGIFDRKDLRDQSQLERVFTSRFGAAETSRLLDLYRENWITPRDFEIVRSWGFNVVRLPFNCRLLLDDQSDELKPDAFRWLDRAVDMARRAGVYVILDLHGAPGGQSLDGVTGEAGRNQFWRPENRQRGAFLWQKIAEHFRDEPTVAAYDLLNEPYGLMSSDNHDAVLVTAMDEMIRAIRQVDERHLIFCAGSLRGIEMYGSPQARGWKNVGLTEHFYPGVYGGTPGLETHARFIGSNLAGRARLLAEWNAPYFAGEFNVVFRGAGGAEMMRRYLDVFQTHGWAATQWAYKLVKTGGGVEPDHWYMVTNREPLTRPDFASADIGQIESFCRSLRTMEYAQASDLREALAVKTPPPFDLGQYAPVLLPASRRALPGWTDTDVSDAFPRGGHTAADGVVQVFGGGRDVYEGSDEFHFVSRAAEGDFELQADATPPTDTHIYAKSGLMCRASLAADAPLVMINLFPEGRCVFAYRRSPGERLTAGLLRLDAGTTTLRLVRRGTVFTATALGADHAEFATQSIDLPNFGSGGNAGFFVLSHDAMQLGKATFSRIKFDSFSIPNPTKVHSP